MSRVAGTVLVVDDNESNLLVAQGHLTAAGYRVILAESGPTALEMFATEPIQVVLLDLMMPGMDGFETCERLRALPGGSFTPIVFLTAANDSGSHQRALEAGADDYLTKPFQGIELLLRVKSLVRIQRLIVELRAHRDALLIAQEERRRLTNMIIHDLKGPIQAVMGYAELLRGQTQDDPETQKFSRQILQAGERMDEMVLGVLNSDSVEGGFCADRSWADLSSLLVEILEGFGSQAKSSGHTLRIECESPELAYFDVALLRRVFENLVRNALEHTSGGLVEIVVHKLGDSHRVEVCDQGQGVPVESRDRIFDPEFSLSGEAGERNQGLGLAFCRLALEAHSSRIWVEDRLEGGSRFCFLLPGLGNHADEGRT